MGKLHLFGKGKPQHGNGKFQLFRREVIGTHPQHLPHSPGKAAKKGVLFHALLFENLLGQGDTGLIQKMRKTRIVLLPRTADQIPQAGSKKNFLFA